MNAVLAKCGRWWATIVVVYALLVSGLAPAVAASAAPSGEICSAATDFAPTGPADLSHHRLDCCILGQPMMLPLGGVAVAVTPVPAGVEASGPVLIQPDLPSPRAPPGSSPHAPRSPPIAS